MIFIILKRLDPSYRVYWNDETHTDVPAKMSELEAWFESHEKGSAHKLRAFLKDAQIKYQVGMEDLVYKPSMSLFEFANKRVLKGLFNMNLFFLENLSEVIFQMKKKSLDYLNFQSYF